MCLLKLRHFSLIFQFSIILVIKKKVTFDMNRRLEVYNNLSSSKLLHQTWQMSWSEWGLITRSYSLHPDMHPGSYQTSLFNKSAYCSSQSDPAWVNSALNICMINLISDCFDKQIIHFNWRGKPKIFSALSISNVMNSFWCGGCIQTEQDNLKMPSQEKPPAPPPHSFTKRW